jgi:hypothetical protein
MIRKNYRKAQKGEVKCPDCGFYTNPWPPDAGFRGRCNQGYAVGKNMTCDEAYNPNIDELVRDNGEDV